MNSINNNRGAVRLKTLFWVLVIASSLYAFYKFVPPEVTFYMMKTEVEDEANIAHMYNDAQLARRILDKAEIWSAPIERQNLEIRRNYSTITISVSYTVTINFFDKWKRVQEYSIFVERPIKGT